MSDAHLINLSSLTVGGNVPYTGKYYNGGGIAFGSSPLITYYRMRGYDSTAGYVHWVTTSPTQTPTITETDPDNTGNITTQHIESSYTA